MIPWFLLTLLAAGGLPSMLPETLSARDYLSRLSSCKAILGWALVFLLPAVMADGNDQEERPRPARGTA